MLDWGTLGVIIAALLGGGGLGAFLMHRPQREKMTVETMAAALKALREEFDNARLAWADERQLLVMKISAQDRQISELQATVEQLKKDVNGRT